LFLLSINEQGPSPGAAADHHPPLAAEWATAQGARQPTIAGASWMSGSSSTAMARDFLSHWKQCRATIETGVKG
jgi:hypothetical protein